MCLPYCINSGLKNHREKNDTLMYSNNTRYYTFIYYLILCINEGDDFAGCIRRSCRCSGTRPDFCWCSRLSNRRTWEGTFALQPAWTDVVIPLASLWPWPVSIYYYYYHKISFVSYRRPPFASQPINHSAAAYRYDRKSAIRLQRDGRILGYDNIM